jgi:hypothetical protein
LPVISGGAFKPIESRPVIGCQIPAQLHQSPAGA